MALLGEVESKSAPFPRTRYQGSKRKLSGAILDALSGLEFVTVLDAFGGTGSVAHAFKLAGKYVTYNDILAFNHQIGVALIENDTVRLTDRDIATIGRPKVGVDYDDFIERTFEGVYFTTDENRWLDVAVVNVRAMSDKYKRALAWFALFQAALAKRPYNLFHRRNLYMRTADVPRSFGNKASWDRAFPEHFETFATEGNAALIDGSGTCIATCADALDVRGEYDLVYIDPPYINGSGTGVDYHQFYHFLEGMVRFDDWGASVDLKSKHRRLVPRDDPWSDRNRCHAMFERLFERFAESVIVVSYRNDGQPSVDELAAMVRAVKSDVRIMDVKSYQYALSTNRRSREVLIIGTGLGSRIRKR